MSSSSSDHFQGKKPLEHVAKKKSEMANEIHGDELPGHQGSFLDALRDTSALLLILWVSALHLEIKPKVLFYFLLLSSIGWLIWKGIRSFWLAAARLERLHRVLKEERYEIENHRPQEREELAALYKAKGFKGPLLEEVLDVLMADDDRLLKVMMEEEMGLTLENCEHPLKVSLGAVFGVLFSSSLLLLMAGFSICWGFLVIAFLLIAFSGLFIAKLQKNEPISAFIWNLGFAVLTFGVIYFLSLWLKGWF